MAAESVVNVMVTANHLASEMLLLLPRMLASFPLTPTKTRLYSNQIGNLYLYVPGYYFILLKKLQY
jgi:hypothetical protein